MSAGDNTVLGSIAHSSGAGTGSSEYHVMDDFCRYLYDIVGVSGDTIATYVHEVQRFHRIVHGKALPMSDFAVEWLKRVRAVPRETRFKEPVPKAVIVSMVQDETEPLAVRVAAMLCWSMCLRLGEITSRRVTESGDWAEVRRRDVAVDAGGKFVSVPLRKRKNDVFNRGGVRVAMADSLCGGDGSVCAVSLVRRYLWESRHMASPDGAFLRFDDGRNVTRRHVTALLKRHCEKHGLDPRLYSGHSIRIGAATAMGEEEIPLDWIKDWGSWLSDAGAVRYLRITDQKAMKIGSALSLSSESGSGRGRGKRGVSVLATRARLQSHGGVDFG